MTEQGLQIGLTRQNADTYFGFGYQLPVIGHYQIALFLAMAQ
jgi:hypothetical protein